MQTDNELRVERVRNALVDESERLGRIIVEIECSDGFTETDYQLMDRLISKRQNEIEQELIMLPESNNE